MVKYFPKKNSVHPSTVFFLAHTSIKKLGPYISLKLTKKELSLPLDITDRFGIIILQPPQGARPQRSVLYCHGSWNVKIKWQVNVYSGIMDDSMLWNHTTVCIMDFSQKSIRCCCCHIFLSYFINCCLSSLSVCCMSHCPEIKTHRGLFPCVLFMINTNNTFSQLPPILLHRIMPVIQSEHQYK